MGARHDFATLILQDGSGFDASEEEAATKLSVKLLAQHDALQW